MTAHSDRSTSSAIAQASHWFIKRTILCVDDELAILRLYRDSLQCAGYNVETYHDSAKALQAARHRSFDLLITDYELSGMKGLEFVRQVRAEGLRQPVILASAKLSPLLEEDLSGIRFAAILIKPFRLPDLIAAVNRTMAYSKPTAPRADQLNSVVAAQTHIARSQSRA